MAVLRKAEDEEVRGVLLQLVQALRYEPADDSRLAAFLVQRAARQPTIAIPLHWCANSERHSVPKSRGCVCDAATHRASCVDTAAGSFRDAARDEAAHDRHPAALVHGGKV